jgi:hypothetical protein
LPSKLWGWVLPVYRYSQVRWLILRAVDVVRSSRSGSFQEWHFNFFESKLTSPIIVFLVGMGQEDVVELAETDAVMYLRIHSFGEHRLFAGYEKIPAL